MKFGGKNIDFNKNSKFEIIVEIKIIFSKRRPKTDRILF